MGKISPMSDTQCGINGWALAGVSCRAKRSKFICRSAQIFTLLSCALFVAEGLVTSFFRQQVQMRTRKHTMV